MPPMPPPNPRPRPRPFPRQVVVLQARTCRNVYDNQPTIDARRGLLDSCNKLAIQGRLSCNSTFTNAVQRALSDQLSIGRFIGQECTTNPVIPTRYY